MRKVVIESLASYETGKRLNKKQCTTGLVFRVFVWLGGWVDLFFILSCFCFVFFSGPGVEPRATNMSGKTQPLS